MRNNRVYMPVDAVDKREDFNLWYADGDVFLTVKCDWSKENSKVAIFNRMGGELGRIKFDPNTLVYFVGVERYEYELHTYTIFEHYFFKGMLWDIMGCLDEPPLDFVNQGTGKSDVRISRVKFKDKGQFYEIKVKVLSKLRIAACAVIAIAINVVNLYTRSYNEAQISDVIASVYNYQADYGSSSLYHESIVDEYLYQ